MTDVSTLPIDKIVWDPKIYPRAKWTTSTIERYADAMEAGDRFPPLVLEEGTDRLLDGKHRYEAYRRRLDANRKWLALPEGERGEWRGSVPTEEIPAEWHAIPEGVSPKRYAARLSARHGDRMSNADLKALAVEDAEADPDGFDVTAFSKEMGVGRQTVYDWVGSVLNRGKEQRQGKVLRLTLLGWTQQEIADHLGDVAQQTVADDCDEIGFSRGKIDTGKSESVLSGIDLLAKRRVERHEIANRFNLPPVLIEAVTLQGKDDPARLSKLGIKIQPYDVWTFTGCHDLMGDAHPGRIPGELVAHVLWRYTQPGDLVIDPMAGSGTTLDACLLLGRKARGYDIDARHERVDVEHHDLSTGWPESAAKADLVFWDPPYFDKMDSTTIGSDGYIDGSVSKLDPDEYLEFFAKRFAELYAAMKPGARLAFLMSDWDSENAKNHRDHRGIFLWDYAPALQAAGFVLTRQIQVPLSTQQVHPDIVTKFRESRRLARLGRYVLIAEKS